MNKTIKLALFLAIIAALATGVLATVNQITAPIIEQNTAGANTAALKELYPEVSTFKQVEFTDESGMVKQAYKADDVAYVFVVESGKGYADKLGFIIGYDLDGSNSKFKMTYNNETKGFGGRLMDEPEYTENMTGISTSDAIYMVSGASVSSTAMKTAIENTIKVFNALTGNTSKPSEPTVENTAKILSSTQIGENTEYVVENKGFAGVNEFKILVDAKGAVLSVENTKFNDTEDIGDMAIAPSHLAKFVGMTKDSFKVELVSGATFTSQSLSDMVKFVLDTHQSSSSSSTPANNPEIISATKTGQVTEYVVANKGFAGVNEFKVVINENGAIESVENTKFNDTEDIGDMAIAPSHLAKFVGMTKDSFKPELVSGATYTSQSLVDVLKYVLEFHGSQAMKHEETQNEAIISKELNGDKVTYQVKLKGFKGENTYEIILDLASKQIVSVVALSMNDTEDIGNKKVGNSEYLAKYSGVSFNTVANVDNVSGATVTADALKAAIMIAIEDSQK